MHIAPVATRGGILSVFFFYMIIFLQKIAMFARGLLNTYLHIEFIAFKYRTWKYQ